MQANRIRFEPGSEGFHTDLRTRVDAYFEERGLSRHANAHVVAKIILFIGVVVGIYAGILAEIIPGIFALVLGFAIAEVGFNVGHDANHRSTSRHAWVNSVLGWSFDLFGGSSHGWNIAHNIVHHTYTNMPGVDRDIDAEPWMRFHSHEKRPAYYRWQHVFAFAFYMLTMLAWTFAKDVGLFMTRDPRTQKRPGKQAWAGMLIGKLVHFTVFLAIPMLVMSAAWWQIILGYVMMQMAVGFTLAVVFQLAHVVEGTEFPRADAHGSVDSSWAEHQLRTTANFSTGGVLATFFTGGLNHQIEHHLFPKISHAHYGALSKIVRRTALEHGLPYNENRSFMAALGSHIRIMRRFGAAVAT